MMKRQVQRFSPHQNAKVFGVLMAVGSLIFFVPFMLVASWFGPRDHGPPLVMALAFPVVYLVFGYLSVALGCWLYNTLFPYIGGIEVEWRDNTGEG